MLRIIGVSEDKFKVLDTDDDDVSLATAETLVLAISDGVELEGCEYGPKGLRVWWDGQEPYDVDVEVWKPVVRKSNGVLTLFSDYEVSNLGRVRSLDRYDCRGHALAGRVLSPIVAGVDRNYRDVGLSLHGVCYRSRVHDLVAIAFLPNPNNFPIINHKDEIGSNNFVSNLEWCTHKYNINYGTCIRRITESLAHRIRQYSYDGEIVREFVCASDAAKFYGCDKDAITNCCSGRSHSSCGFVWRYCSSDELFELSKPDRASAIVSNRHSSMRVVRRYSLSGDFLEEYQGLSSISKYRGIRHSISRCCLGQQKAFRGYIWRYVTDDEFADRPENAKAIEEFRKSRGSYNGGSLETS